MANPRKGKILIKAWLDESELRILEESLKQGITSISWTIIHKAYKRGDLILK